MADLAVRGGRVLRAQRLEGGRVGKGLAIAPVEAVPVLSERVARVVEIRLLVGKLDPSCLVHDGSPGRGRVLASP